MQIQKYVRRVKFVDVQTYKGSENRSALVSVIICVRISAAELVSRLYIYRATALRFSVLLLLLFS